MKKLKLTSKFKKLKKVEYSSESESSESEDGGGYLARRFFTHPGTHGSWVPGTHGLRAV